MTFDVRLNKKLADMKTRHEAVYQKVKMKFDDMAEDTTQRHMQERIQFVEQTSSLCRQVAELEIANEEIGNALSDRVSADIRAAGQPLSLSPGDTIFTAVQQPLENTVAAAVLPLTVALCDDQHSHKIDPFVDLVMWCRVNPAQANIKLTWKGFRGNRDITATYFQTSSAVPLSEDA